MSETEVYDLRVTVERIEGRSVCGLAVGDYFEVTESSRVRIPEGKHFCLYALSSVLPLLPAKQRQMPPGDWLEQDNFVACPDPDERTIMRHFASVAGIWPARRLQRENPEMARSGPSRMSALWLLTGLDRTSRRQPNSVENDPTATSA